MRRERKIETFLNPVKTLRLFQVPLWCIIAATHILNIS